jgi:uncharacterized membrane protein
MYRYPASLSYHRPFWRQILVFFCLFGFYLLRARLLLLFGFFVLVSPSLCVFAGSLTANVFAGS